MKKIVAGLVIAAIAVLVGFVLFVRSQTDTIGPVTRVEGAEGLFTARNLMVDMYAFAAGDEVILIGAGIDTSGAALDGLLEGAGIEGGRERVSRVFITHGHPDHINGASRVPNARVYIGAPDVDLMAGRVPNRTFAQDILSVVFVIDTPSPTDALTGTREVSVGPIGETVFVIPFPGHTPGSYLYFFRGVLFTGDSFDYVDGELRLPKAETHVDFEQFLTSTLALPTLLQGRDVIMICTGHGGCTPPEDGEQWIDKLVSLAIDDG